jgi:hypothetical protein
MEMTCATGAVNLLNSISSSAKADVGICYGISRWRPMVALQFPAKLVEQLHGADLDVEPGHESDGAVET